MRDALRAWRCTACGGVAFPRPGRKTVEGPCPSCQGSSWAAIELERCQMCPNYIPADEMDKHVRLEHDEAWRAERDAELKRLQVIPKAGPAPLLEYNPENCIPYGIMCAIVGAVVAMCVGAQGASILTAAIAAGFAGGLILAIGSGRRAK